MNLAIFGFLTDTVALLKTIIIVMILVGLVWACIQIPQIVPIIISFATVIIFVFGAVSAVETVKYFQTRNITVGEVIQTMFKQNTTANDVEDNPLAWDLKNLGFQYDGDSSYSTTIEKPKNEAIDLQNNTYSLYINNEKCHINETGRDFVKSQFLYNFYDSDDSLILMDTLYINFGFYNNQTIIELTTKGGENAVNLWKSFQVKNGFLFELVKDEITPTKLNQVQFVTRSQLEDNERNDTFTINLFINENIDFGETKVSNGSHPTYRGFYVTTTRLASDSSVYGTTYHNMSLGLYYTDVQNGYNRYTGSFKNDQYKFLDFGDSPYKYIVEETAEMGQMYTVSNGRDYNKIYIDSFYDLKVDLSQCSGNPTGKILNIYIDIQK